MKTKSLIIALSIWATSQLFATEPPSPVDVAYTASNLWISSNLTGFAEFSTNLYASYSNYVPAIILSSFHDGIFNGDLSTMAEKLDRVQEYVDYSPSNYTEAFTGLLAQDIYWLNEEINMHKKMGRSEAQVRSNASASTVRSVWAEWLPPPLPLLYYAPATNLPEERNSEKEVQQGGPGYPPQGVGSPDP